MGVRTVANDGLHTRQANVDAVCGNTSLNGLTATPVAPNPNNGLLVPFPINGK